MSRLSDERISKLAHNIINNLISKQLVDPTRRGELLSVIRNGFFEFEKFNDSLDNKVREKIASLSKKIPEGSEEWKILYAKYKEDILKRQKIGRIKN